MLIQPINTSLTFSPEAGPTSYLANPSDTISGSRYFDGAPPIPPENDDKWWQEPDSCPLDRPSKIWGLPDIMPPLPYVSAKITGEQDRVPLVDLHLSWKPNNPENKPEIIILGINHVTNKDGLPVAVLRMDNLASLACATGISAYLVNGTWVTNSPVQGLEQGEACYNTSSTPTLLFYTEPDGTKKPFYLQPELLDSMVVTVRYDTDGTKIFVLGSDGAEIKFNDTLMLDPTNYPAIATAGIDGSFNLAPKIIQALPAPSIESSVGSSPQTNNSANHSAEGLVAPPAETNPIQPLQPSPTPELKRLMAQTNLLPPGGELILPTSQSDISTILSKMIHDPLVKPADILRFILDTERDPRSSWQKMQDFFTGRPTPPSEFTKLEDPLAAQVPLIFTDTRVYLDQNGLHLIGRSMRDVSRPNQIDLPVVLNVPTNSLSSFDHLDDTLIGYGTDDKGQRIVLLKITFPGIGNRHAELLATILTESINHTRADNTLALNSPVFVAPDTVSSALLAPMSQAQFDNILHAAATENPTTPKLVEVWFNTRDKNSQHFMVNLPTDITGRLSTEVVTCPEGGECYVQMIINLTDNAYKPTMKQFLQRISNNQDFRDMPTSNELVVKLPLEYVAIHQDPTPPEHGSYFYPESNINYNLPDYKVFSWATGHIVSESLTPPLVLPKSVDPDTRNKFSREVGLRALKMLVWQQTHGTMST